MGWLLGKSIGKINKIFLSWSLVIISIFIISCSTKLENSLISECVEPNGFVDENGKRGIDGFGFECNNVQDCLSKVKKIDESRPNSKPTDEEELKSIQCINSSYIKFPPDNFAKELCPNESCFACKTDDDCLNMVCGEACKFGKEDIRVKCDNISCFGLKYMVNSLFRN